MKRNTKLVGDISEAKVLAALIEAGLQVLIPFGENHRYDLVIDRGDGFLRVQVKTGRLRNGVVLFNAKNAQRAKIRWAEAYRLGGQFEAKVVGLKPESGVSLSGSLL